MVSTISSNELRTIDTPLNIQRLDRFFQIEKNLMLIQAAKLPELVSWTLKQQIGYHLFEDMQHADALRRRRMELPGGRRDLAPLDADLTNALHFALTFQGDAVFCSALFVAVKSLLVAAYREHLGQTNIVSDLPSRKIIEKNIAEHERQIAWIQGAIALMPAIPEERKNAGLAIEQVQSSIIAAGGILGESPKRPASLPPSIRYELIKDARREPRQKVTLDFAVPTGRDDIDRKVLSQFTAYFREMAAAETVAGMLWDAPKNIPWEFYADTARHCWDEIRHCQAGQQRLEKLGLDIWQVPVQTGNYNIRARMTPLERYAYITQVEEKSSFPHKHENEHRFRSAGDSLSADMVAYDIADETLHVKLGVKWLPELQKALGDTRPFDQLVADATAHRDEVFQSLQNSPIPAALNMYGY
jgi:bacterioferritin (cytochrome b1)